MGEEIVFIDGITLDGLKRLLISILCQKPEGMRTAEIMEEIRGRGLLVGEKRVREAIRALVREGIGWMDYRPFLRGRTIVYGVVEDACKSG